MSRAAGGGLRGRLTDPLFAAGWALVRALPERAAYRLFRLGADLAARRGGPGVAQLERNLRRVAPGQDLTRAALRSYARYWCEVFRLPALPPRRILAGMTLRDGHRLWEALAAPTGTVLALPHSGNWDHAGAWCGLSGAPFTTVAERLRPEVLYERFLAFRRGLGMEVLPLTGGQRPTYDLLVERLAAGGMLCLLADRDLSVRGVDVTFFGDAARLPAGPAALCLQTGATLLPVTLAFAPDGWLCTFHEPVAHTDVPTMTQALADAFAAGIAAHPADWHMLQRLWLADLPADDPRRTARTTGAA